MRFYFNEALPAYWENTSDPHALFQQLMNKTRRLSYRPLCGKANAEIITHTLPSNITVGQIPLTDLISSIAQQDRDLSRFTYRAFTKYPIEEYLKLREDMDNDLYEHDFKLAEQDATNLIIASRHNVPVLSVPMASHLRKDLLVVESTKADFNSSIVNFYGDNISFITTWHLDRIISPDSTGKIVRENNYNRFLYCLDEFIEEIDIKTAPVVEEKFKALAPKEQILLIEALKTAAKRNLISPLRTDDAVIKQCRGKGNEDTYELRAEGLRMYFKQPDNKRLLFGGLHTKAESVGVEQSADINRATYILRNM